MASQIQIRRGTAAAWLLADPILAEGEVGIETDDLGTTDVKRKYGNGVDIWSVLPYQAGGSGTPLEVEDEGISVDTDTTKINFTGAGVDATTGGAGIVNVDIPAGGGGSGTVEVVTGAAPITVGNDATVNPEVQLAAAAGPSTDGYMTGEDKAILDQLDADTSGTNTGDVTSTPTAEITTTVTGQDLTSDINAGSIDESKLDASVNASLDLADSAAQDSGYNAIEDEDTPIAPESVMNFLGSGVSVTPGTGQTDILVPGASAISATFYWNDVANDGTVDPGTGYIGGDNVTNMGAIAIITISSTTATGGTLPPDTLYTAGDVIILADKDRVAYGRYEVVSVGAGGVGFHSFNVIATTGTGNPAQDNLMDGAYIPQRAASGGQVDSVVGGTGIDVDAADPVNPIVNLDAATIASLGEADTAVQSVDGIGPTAGDVDLPIFTQTVKGHVPPPVTAPQGDVLDDSGNWVAQTGGGGDILTTKGDLLTAGPTPDVTLPKGTDGFVLSVDDAEATGLKWVAQTGGAGDPIPELTAVWTWHNTPNTVPPQVDTVNANTNNLANITQVNLSNTDANSDTQLWMNQFQIGDFLLLSNTAGDKYARLRISSSFDGGTYTILGTETISGFGVMGSAEPAKLSWFPSNGVPEPIPEITSIWRWKSDGAAGNGLMSGRDQAGAVTDQLLFVALFRLEAIDDAGNTVLPDQLFRVGDTLLVNVEGVNRYGRYTILRINNVDDQDTRFDINVEIIPDTPPEGVMVDQDPTKVSFIAERPEAPPDEDEEVVIWDNFSSPPLANLEADPQWDSEPAPVLTNTSVVGGSCLVNGVTTQTKFVAFLEDADGAKVSLIDVAVKITAPQVYTTGQAFTYQPITVRWQDADNYIGFRWRSDASNLADVVQNKIGSFIVLGTFPIPRNFTDIVFQVIGTEITVFTTDATTGNPVTTVIATPTTITGAGFVGMTADNTAPTSTPFVLFSGYETLDLVGTDRSSITESKWMWQAGGGIPGPGQVTGVSSGVAEDLATMTSINVSTTDAYGNVLLGGIYTVGDLMLFRNDNTDKNGRYQSIAVDNSNPDYSTVGVNPRTGQGVMLEGEGLDIAFEAQETLGYGSLSATLSWPAGNGTTDIGFGNPVQQMDNWIFTIKSEPLKNTFKDGNLGMALDVAGRWTFTLMINCEFDTDVSDRELLFDLWNVTQGIANGAPYAVVVPAGATKIGATIASPIWNNGVTAQGKFAPGDTVTVSFNGDVAAAASTFTGFKVLGSTQMSFVLDEPNAGV